jgi:hypothetical protein
VQALDQEDRHFRPAKRHRWNAGSVGILSGIADDFAERPGTTGICGG